MPRLHADTAQKQVTAAGGPFTLPPLPYALTALAPAISARTLRFHHGKHHKAYVDKLNELVADTPFAAMTLEEIVKKTAHDPAQAALFHNAGQAWNHAFYWNCLTPQTTRPSAALKAAIARDFGDMKTFKDKLAKTATEHFGSGWAWLIAKNKKLSIVDTSDADTPLEDGAVCLLTVDVWEHAYYLDRQNERKAYVAAVVEGLLNWSFAAANFDKA